AFAAAGPRAAGRREDVAFVVEAIREGYLLHYATGRLLRDDDRDLVLLAGAAWEAGAAAVGWGADGALQAAKAAARSGAPEAPAALRAAARLMAGEVARVR